MQGIIITGIAGSGKTTLTKSYLEWLKEELGAEVSAVNLDPGALTLPYEAVFDAREIVKVEDLMISEGLGPNGALIRATEILASKIDEMIRSVSKLKSDYVLIDTPGQMEVFALRWSGRKMIKGLKSIINLAGIFLGDHEPGRELIDSITTAFLSKIIELKLEIPMIPTLNKVDLWEDSSIKEVWEALFTGKVEERLIALMTNQGVMSELLVEMSKALTSFSSPIRVIPISARKRIGFEGLFDALNEVWCACGDLT